MTSWLSDTSANKVVKTYVNGFMDCSGYFLNRVGNVMIGNTDYPGYNVNQRSLLVNGRTQMNGNLTINGNISVNSTNIALGLNAAAGTVGTNTVAIGSQAGQTNLGTDSIAIGYNTSVSQLGSQSTAVGSYSGYNQTGSYNTFIGREAGYDSAVQRTGSYNTYIGYAAQANASNYSSSTAIGIGAVITASNQIKLGTASENVSIPGRLIQSASAHIEFYTNNNTSNIQYYNSAGTAQTSGNYNQELYYKFITVRSNLNWGTPYYFRNAGLYVPYTGIYNIQFSPALAGNRESFISKNGMSGNDINTSTVLLSSGGTNINLSLSGTTYMSANEYINIAAYCGGDAPLGVRTIFSVTLLQRTA